MSIYWNLMATIKPVLIIGTLPPPIGGVSIHLRRLIETLNLKKIPYKFLDYRRQPFWFFFQNFPL